MIDMITTEASPALRAQNDFVWVPLDGGTPGQFTVKLFSGGVVKLASSGYYNAIVESAQWDERTQSVVKGFFWRDQLNLTGETKRHLLQEATNALRGVL